MVLKFCDSSLITKLEHIMLLRLFAILLMCGIIAANPFSGDNKASEPQTVPSVDLARYAGRWYEIARLPNSFEKKCAGGVAATYELRPDGRSQ